MMYQASSWHCPSTDFPASFLALLPSSEPFFKLFTVLNSQFMALSYSPEKHKGWHPVVLGTIVVY